MRRERSGIRGLLHLLVVVLLLGSIQGCGLIVVGGPPPFAGTGSGPFGPTSPTSTTTGTDSLTPTSQTGTLPPSITGPGESSTTPPLAQLPVPTESKSEADRLVQKFGLTAIAGSNATLDNLRTLETSYARFPSGSFRDLTVVIESATSDSSPTINAKQGLWEGFNRAGEPITDDLSDLTPAAARITYYEKSLTEWYVTHEATHHVTLYIDLSYGQRFIQTLGYVEQPSSYRSDLIRTLKATYDRQKVDAKGFPSLYAAVAPPEHVAELTCSYLSAGTPVDPESGFVLPEPARTILAERFGQRDPG